MTESRIIRDFSRESSLINEVMSQLRDVDIQKSRSVFSANLHRLGQMMAYEVSKVLPYKEQAVTTPLGVSKCQVLSEQPIIATILRAGLPMQAGMLSFFEKADACFVSAYRKHNADDSFSIQLGYHSHPSLKDRILILCDPMLATGKSMVAVYNQLVSEERPKTTHIVSAVAAKEGLEFVKKEMPDAHIWLGAVDPELNSKFYIVPGLGDAGDLAFGEKEQH